ncbi:GNAT family N-acetyltransferase [Chamaesiphon minutus]|uniref:Transglutaminase-like enzyme, predicted cysteine protease n=1 Tax=Chamaesiphon minutus (strain ATCC 27169 / PCC 6605) TaxID=1173020 RepID=K9UB98_CHAP6|nr:GNAT family N-acetyltransferase [Chamaesiphon minutus]AFY91711.1 transglutaminase-like enzyme, predicted cysteine protease [Chamaesiphon minutus PCC 6605]
MQKYLKSSEIIDWQHPDILALAHQIASTHQTTPEIAKACFEWVRDEIHHSHDYQMNPVTCRASDVLKYRTGYCFAKSHLLAALLRANNIPAGLCYQRLSIDDLGAPYTLHGLNAICLPQIGWYRVDSRGNREGVNARFTPPQEQLAYEIRLPQEADFGNIFSEPLPIVIEVLQTSRSWDEVLHSLPDVSLEIWQQHQLILQIADYNIRTLTNQDESILWTMLMYAAHESSVDTVRENPALDRYVKDWGKSGDFGLVAIDNTHALGAAWLRLFPSNNRGFGYVDEGIPELAIAVLPEHRGKGIGTKLLIQTIELASSLYPAISLSVRANNPVINLYQRAGFVKVDGSEILNRTGISSFNMIYRYD